MNDTPELAGKTALITGAARGIGLAIAHALASRGCAVAIQDIDLDEARKQVELLKSQGHRALALGGDISDTSLPSQLIDATTKEFSALDILINNAGIQSTQPWQNLTIEQFDRTFHANVAAPILLSQLAAPIFIQQKWGRIINIGSGQHLRGNPRMLDYAMSKAAIANMTEALARDLGPHNVTVNNIAPGYFDTLRNAHHFPTELTSSAAHRASRSNALDSPRTSRAWRSTCAATRDRTSPDRTSWSMGGCTFETRTGAA
jgi:NAD(P)-dependent dehydrogenase (short-subunit alcohol dehydrogenase family)